MERLAELLEAYARGETDKQHAVLDEVEPLLFGMVRSLLPGGPDAHARAVALANALTLAFHLRAEAGRVRLADANALRRYAHAAASRKLRDPAPLPLRPLADPDTGSMVYACYGLGLTLAGELTPDEVALFAERLAGVPADELDAPPGTWERVQRRLVACGILRG